MLETGRSPRTEDEHMIAGNARLMAEIPHLLAEPLTPALIRQLHAIGMGGINDAKYRPGEFRETDDVVIADYDGNSASTVRCGIVTGTAGKSLPVVKQP